MKQVYVTSGNFKGLYLSLHFYAMDDLFPCELQSLYLVYIACTNILNRNKVMSPIVLI